jgi:hypothetical protein
MSGSAVAAEAGLTDNRQEKRKTKLNEKRIFVMRKLMLPILVAFSLSLSLVACGDSREGMKLSKQPFDKTKCETYRNLAQEAQKKNEKDIMDALRNYNSQCFMNMDSLEDVGKKKGMPDPR